ncbi:MAG: hypothetical protein WB664_09905 [Nitrososphaeraceae archaeon]
MRRKSTINLYKIPLANGTRHNFDLVCTDLKEARPYTIAFNVTFLVGVIISLSMVEMILIMKLQAFIMGMPLNR